MRLRTVLFLAFLSAFVLPAAVYSVGSYRAGVTREFAEVNERHLLLAKNVAVTLDRYRRDVEGTFESIVATMIAEAGPLNLDALMNSINLLCVVLLDTDANKVIARTLQGDVEFHPKIAGAITAAARKAATSDASNFTPVLDGDKAGNVMLITRSYGNALAIGVLSTRFFDELGRSISFGEKGHAAIVDHEGNVLAHPLPHWVEERKNIAKVSAVRRMLNGETGIEQFFSPALKGDMIAGLTHVEETGWGVMIPQPVSELYAKVLSNNSPILAALALGLIIALLLTLLMVRMIAMPLEQLLQMMKSNARARTLNRYKLTKRTLVIKETYDLWRNYSRMVTRVGAAMRVVERQAFTDPTTGLINRQRLELLAGNVLKDTATTQAFGSLIVICLDDLKAVNDIHGHAFGEDYLAAQGKRLELACKMIVSQLNGVQTAEPPLISRLDGDAFALLIPQLTGEEELNGFLHLLTQYLAAPISHLEALGSFSTSIGCARYPQDAVQFDELMKLAEIAALHARKGGKNRTEIYKSSIGKLTSSELLNAIEQAIDHDILRLEYQPKVCAQKAMVTGVEALVRWTHPTLGVMPPQEWVPAIAGTALIAKLGNWVAERAVTDCARWVREGHTFHVAINIGAAHLLQRDFEKQMKDCVNRHDLDPSMLELELTEDAVLGQSEAVLDTVSRLQDGGFRIAIDDFGTGYSNIARLSRLRVNALKVDRSVVAKAHLDQRSSVLLECIVMMGHKLGCTIVAEGVENAEIAKFARDRGVQTLQGYHFSKALPYSELMEWVESFELKVAHVRKQARVA